MSLPKLAVTRPITMLMIFLAMVLIGYVSLTLLPIELMPNISFHRITIIINVRGGMPPTEVESLVTKLVEESVSTVSHLKGVRSISEKGRSIVIITFEPGTDMDFAALEVREKFAKIKNKLPKEIEKPVIAKYEQTDLPIIILAVLSSNRSTEDLRKLVDENIKERLQRINGVANVEVGGGRERKILVEVHQPRLQAYGISIHRVTSVLGLNNLNLLSGQIEKDNYNYLVRNIGEFKSIEDIKNIGVLTTAYGSIIRLKDIADVKDSYLEATNIARVNVQPVVSIYVQKETTANTIEVAEKIEKEIETIRKSLDKDIRIIITSNDADYIKEAIRTVKDALLFGAILAVLILTIFLRSIRSTIIIALSIPISVIMTFSLIYFTGITLNIMTLSGLALGIGMLVDNSIVVLENIFRHKQLRDNLNNTADKKLEDKRTAVIGSQEMLLAIVASTITTIVVFLPIVFVSKQIKLLYSGLALTVTFSITVSLFVALTLVPLMMSRFKEKAKAEPQFFKRIKKVYVKSMLYVMRRRYFFIVGVFVLFCIALFGFSKLDMEFLESSGDQSEFTVFVELPSGAKLEKSDEVVARVEQILRNVPEIKTISSRIEGWSSKVYVTLVPFAERQKSVADVINELRPKVRQITNAFIYFSDPPGPKSTEVFVDLYGYSYDILKELAVSIGNRLSTIEGLTDIKMRYREGRPEMRFNVDKPKTGSFGFTTKDVAETAHAKIRGLRATKYHTEGREIETITRLAPQYRTTFDEIRKMTFTLPSGISIYLEQLADVDFGLGPSEIWRENKQRMIQVSATTQKITLSKAIKLIKQALSDIKFPKDYFYQFGGDYEQILKNHTELKFAMLLTILLVYMVLAALFESYYQPFIIMTTVPLALIGASAALWMSFKLINMGAMIGIIMLFGIVVNNAIILVDRVNSLKKKSKSRTSYKSVLYAGKDRLRPILMTTSTTVLGLAPMAFNKSESASLWAPLACSVIGGLTISTFLTLFIIPCIYLAFEDVKKTVTSFKSQVTNFKRKILNAKTESK